ncbi:methyltransferase type 11 [Streptomyces avidinii]
MNTSERQVTNYPAPPAPWSSGPYGQAVHAPVGGTGTGGSTGIGGHGGEITLRDGEGWYLPLDVGRRSGRADAADRAVLERCAGKVLDVGCGAGRLAPALTRRGHAFLGIDVSPSAVISTADRDRRAPGSSVFGPVPHEGTWDTALLVDGNIGISGDPPQLMRRIHDLVHPGGLLIVEASPREVDERRRVRIHVGQCAVSPVFSWATVGVLALVRHGRLSGWAPVEQWTSRSGGRPFVAFRACA